MAQEMLALVALLGLGLAGGGLLASWLRLPPAVGYLGVGVAVAGTKYHHAIPEPVVGGMAEIGVLFLLFLIGLELDLPRLRNALKSSAWVLPFDVAIPAALVGGGARLIGWSFGEALAVGICVAISSTLFGETLTRRADVGNPARQRVLGVLIAEDVAAGVLLALLVVIAGGTGLGAGQWLAPALSIGRLMFLMLLLAAGALLVVPRLLDNVAKRHQHELVLLWATALILLFGYIGFLAGSAELGALVAGVAAAEAGSRFVVRNSLTGLRDAALAVFFLASGLAVNPHTAGPLILPALGLAAVFLFAKILVHVPAALAAGLGVRPALQVAFALGTVGEFSLILVTVAEKEGLAHPDLRSIVVITAAILLLVASVLQPQAGRIAERMHALPRGIHRPLSWLVHSMRRSDDRAETDRTQERRAIRLLVANLSLLLALALVTVAVADRWMPALEARSAFWGPTLLLGASMSLAIPLLRGAYRAYRALVWQMVGLRPGERAGAGRVRSILVDAWTAFTGFLVLVFVALRSPQALPIMVGGGLVAVIVATFAWRRLSSFHRTLEGSLTRVLGDDPTTGHLLDDVMRKYPWGVRFAAVPVPKDSPLVGHSLLESRLSKLTGATVAVIQRRGREIVNPGPEERLHIGDTVLVLGDAHQLERAEALIVSSGDALRLEAQSQSASIGDVEIAPGSPWEGKTLLETNIREETGAMVLGVWQSGAEHPAAYDRRILLDTGDRLIVLGTPLQVDRARAAAAPPEPDED